MRPLVLLDVDGVVNALTGAVPVSFKAMGYPIRMPDYMPGLVQKLVAHNEVMWCTTWRNDANTHLTRYLGIEPLAVVDDGTEDRYVDWKVAAARPYVRKALMDGRRVCWIEDFERIPYGGIWDYIDYIDTSGTMYVLKEESVFSWLLGR